MLFHIIAFTSIVVCNWFYGKIYCGRILYSIVKNIVVGYMYYGEISYWAVLCIIGNIFLRRAVYDLKIYWSVFMHLWWKHSVRLNSCNVKVLSLISWLNSWARSEAGTNLVLVRVLLRESRGILTSRGRLIGVRLPRSLIEAAEKPHGRADDRGEAPKKPLRGCWEASWSGGWPWWGSQEASSRLLRSLMVGRMTVVRLPRKLIVAAEKPHRGCWEASSRLMWSLILARIIGVRLAVSLIKADSKPHGRWHDRG